MMMFFFGMVTMAAVFFAATTVWLLQHGRKPPDRTRAKSKRDMERQLSNLLRYNGSEKGQEAEDDGVDD